MIVVQIKPYIFLCEFGWSNKCSIFRRQSRFGVGIDRIVICMGQHCIMSNYSLPFARLKSYQFKHSHDLELSGRLLACCLRVVFLCTHTNHLTSSWVTTVIFRGLYHFNSQKHGKIMSISVLVSIH